jgi:hypothetical protein
VLRVSLPKAMPRTRHVVLTSAESWIDVSSQHSTSSLASLANDAQPRLRNERIPRPLVPTPATLPNLPRSVSATGSSQDEYEESSSESDRVMSSSNEDLSPEDDVAEDDDDNRTALGVRPSQTFTPQPNAFSHPPSTQHESDSYFPRVTSAPTSHIRYDRSSRARPYLQRERERAMSTSQQPDHDAALRASLTTLLSCAAAVRPKPPTSTSPDKDKSPETRSVTTRPSTRPTMMRLIPESELDARQPSPKPSKRRSRESSKDRQAKKARATQNNKMSGAVPYSYDDYFISPTVASWVISAGMVLVFSAISFSAGYAWGRDVGRAEAELGLAGSCGSCGRDALRSSGGLRKLHWGSSSAVKA